MNYIGRICPFCENEIEEGDFVVFCSRCKTPHHFDCWKANKGCTTYACDGKLMTLEEYENAPAPVNYARTESGGSSISKKTIQNTGEKRMELKALKCPNCTGALEVEDGLDTFFCKYCGYKIVMADLSEAAYKAKSAVIQYRHEETMQDKEHLEAKARWERQEITKQRDDKRIIKVFMIFMGVMGIFLAIPLIFGLGIPSINHSIKIKKLEKISVEVEESIESHDYDHALLVANTLRLSDGWSSSDTKEWDDRRNTYLRQIRDAQRKDGNYKIINSPIDSTECTKYTKSEMVDKLSEAGFKNIRAEEKDGSAGFFKKEHLVISVTIDGYSEFTKVDSFYDDSDVIIEYYEE